MRIKDKAQFALGIIDILLGITVAVLAVVQHKEDRLITTAFVLLCGIMALSNGIETKRQRRRKEEELKAWIAFWNGEDGEENV